MKLQERLVARTWMEFCGTCLLAYTVAFTASAGLSTVSQALSVGLCVSMIIHIIGRYSGAHLNPAVTLILRVNSVGLRGAFSKDSFLEVGSYIFAQIIGSMAGFAAYLSGASSNVPANKLDGSAEEMMLTVILLLLILAWAKEGRLCPFAQPLTGIVIGGGVAFLSVLGGATASGILNPAIALGLLMYTDIHGLSSMLVSECISVGLVCCFILICRRWPK